MDSVSPPQCPQTVTVRRNPPRRARPQTTPGLRRVPRILNPSSAANDMPSFPTDQILSMEIPNPKPDPVAENLRVFLRIRPLLTSKPAEKRSGAAAAADQSSKARSKNAWPQNPTKKTAARDQAVKKRKNVSSTEVCVKLNNARSVTVSPPLALQESNRTKSEVYDGFSQVFSADSSQEEVYEMMVKSLVEDFLRGKSGMLAALGPSGSGKTHTVFGTTRDPGMVPLALQHIFKGSTKYLRSIFISMFEISTEGKAEKWIDLSPNGGEIIMQQSALKGIQEIAVSDARQAECLIAQAMLRRSTATTNSNSQSSRSQCIINIRGVACKFDGEEKDQPNEVVLSIVDLAGAEREKRTGNQGTRLLESNFINNTSMVFGLCLRSLLEHQKNPKKPLQKHFQNSLLTKYLRDYLEGKKRMTLILTIKSGEEDYRDTSQLLRQASPYMEIKFNNAEEPPTIPNKRHFQALARTEQHKRMKLTCSELTFSESCTIEERISVEDENGLSDKGPPRVCLEEITVSAPSKSGCADSQEVERNHKILQNLSRAMWNVLKEYKEKVKVADNEIEHLRESLMTESKKRLELQKELNDTKSFCTCFCIKSIEVDTNLKATKQVDGHESSNVDQTSCLGTRDSNSTFRRLDSTPKKDQDMLSQVKTFCLGESDGSITPKSLDSTLKIDQETFSQDNLKGYSFLDMEQNVIIMQSQTDEKQIETTVGSLDVCDVSIGLGGTKQLSHQISKGLPGSRQSSEDFCESNCLIVENSYPNSPNSPTLSVEDEVDKSEEAWCLPRSSTGDVQSKWCGAANVADSEPNLDETSEQEKPLEDVANKECIAASVPAIEPSVGDLCESNCIRMVEGYTNADVGGHLLNSYDSRRKDSCSSVELDDLVTEEVEESSEDLAFAEHSNNIDLPDSESERVSLTLSVEGEVAKSQEAWSSPRSSTGDVATKGCDDANVAGSEPTFDETSKPKEYVASKDCNAANMPDNEPSVDRSLKQEKPTQDVATDECNAANVPVTEPSVDKPPKLEKPKRRLLPASSVSLRNYNAFDLEDDNEKPKVGRKKTAPVERNRTRGTIALISFLKSNLRT